MALPLLLIIKQDYSDITKEGIAHQAPIGHPLAFLFVKKKLVTHSFENIHLTHQLQLSVPEFNNKLGV